MLNEADYNRFSDLYWVCLKTNDHINFKLGLFSGHTASLISEFRKFRIFIKFELSSMGKSTLHPSPEVIKLFYHAQLN